MTGVLSITITLSVGFLAGVLAHRFRLPGGAIVASLLTVGALHLLVSELSPLGQGYRVGAQIMIGIVIGATLKREPFRTLRRALVPVSITVVLILVAAALGGFALHHITGLSLFSALLATVPGGAGDVTAAALALDQDAAIVAGFHLIRQLAIFVVVATVFQFVFGEPMDTDPDEEV